MTPKQIDLARHALGLDGRRAQSYRNRFVAGDDHDDFQDWQQMVRDGNAQASVPQKLYGGMVLFNLTLIGAKKALKPAETLDREDFPEAP